MAFQKWHTGAALQHRSSAWVPLRGHPRSNIRTHIHIKSHALSPGSFAEQMLAVEGILPSMTCEQLAKTGRTVLETYRTAMLHSEAAVDATAAGTGDLLNYFISQLPHQSWMLTYRAAVEQHLDHHQQSLHSAVCNPSLASAQSATSGTASGPQQPHNGNDTSGASFDGNDTSETSFDGIEGCHDQAQHLGKCTPEDLQDILAAVAAMPIQVVQPLPIGFGTPRWSRPLAAADPAAWEHWLTSLTITYAELLAAQHAQQQQQTEATTTHQQEEGYERQEHGCRDASEQLLLQLADFVVSLACSMRWVNVNVDDDKLQTADFRERLVQCLQQQQCQQQEQLSPSPAFERHPQQCAVPFGLAGSLTHRLTLTCLLMLLPPPRPMLSAFFEATSPEDFNQEQLQGILRGLLFAGCAPPESWLRGLVDLVRGRVAELDKPDLMVFVEAFRFFGTQVGRPPWLRDVTALMEEHTVW